MGDNTRIYDRFEWWSVDDCSCEYCINYPGKNQPCPLETCCVEDIRKEALLREQAAHNGATTRTEAMSCPA
jgi:hypothetical protein